MNQHLRLVDGEAVEIPEFTRDIAGYVVDLRPVQWRLNSTTAQHTLMDWTKLVGCDEASITALRVHIVRLIETNGTAHVSNAFRVLSSFLTALRDHRLPASASLANLMWYFEQLRGKRLGYQFHYVKQWYISSADRLLEGFDDEMVFALEDLSVGGNAKGFAVLSADPEQGPLTEFEEAALRHALLRDDGPIEQRAALWLAFAFGTNPANLSLLREEDFIRFNFPGDTPSAYFLNVPRIKKRQPERTGFKKRAIDNPLAVVIEDLITRNAAMSKDDAIRPLFRLTEPRPALLGGPLSEYAHHPSSGMITNLIAECVARLDVKSPRTREPLKVTTRRLRYTFASKMVRMGTPARELAELLDHTDTQQVQVYYKADSRFVERLDATIAENIGPTVRAFMGEIVERQNRTIDLIPFRDLPELGQCGASFITGEGRDAHIIGSHLRTAIASDRYEKPVLVRSNGRRQSLGQSLIVLFLHASSHAHASNRFISMPVTWGQMSDFLCGRSILPSVFERRKYLGDDGKPYRIRSHDFRRLLNMIAQRGGLTQAEIAQWMGRRRIVDNAVYDLRTPTEMAAEMRELVAKHEVYGIIADQVLALPEAERGTFLEARLAMSHTTPHGQCASNIAESPCATAMSCLGGCRQYLRRNGDTKSRESLLRIERETLVALHNAREAMAAGKFNAENWVRAQETILKTTRAALAIDDDPSTEIGDLRHVSPHGPLIGEPL